MTSIRWTLILALAAPVAGAQSLPERAPSRDVEAGIAPMLDAGLTALADGDRPAARAHLERALWQQPYSPPVLLALVSAYAGDDDGQAVIAHRLAAAIGDERGSFRLDRDQRGVMPKDPWLKKIASARAAAAAELQRLAVAKARRLRSEPSDWLIIRHLQRVAAEVIAPAPALWDAVGADINGAAKPPPDPWTPAIEALVRLVDDALLDGRSDAALEAARALMGITTQASFPGLKGPEPRDLSEERALAANAIDRVRAERDDGSPLTVGELRAMTHEERIAFTAAHTDWLDPGVAVTESGKYRVETTCGHGTLLGAVETLELHHARLANWFGRDPFETQGIVRIVPVAAGLEHEGVPHWWAGGFQAGDVTTVRFSASTMASLGTLLTHELTHRFDGAIHPGLPAWLSEGRAVWTEESYAQTTDTGFVEDHADFGRLESTWLKGYGGRAELEKLLTGDVDDYRDNYDGGYSLYLFLSTHELGGARRYRDVIPRYLAACAEPTDDEVARFESFFADGAGGRPSGLDAFAGRFDAFLQDFYWLSRGPISRRYRPNIFKEIGDEVYDYPTWRFTRVRAEPWFGDEQAARAADVLARHGDPRGALASLLWARHVDEWSADRSRDLARLLEQTGLDEAAWVARSSVGDAEPCPIKGLTKTRSYLSQLAKAAADYRAAGHDTAAAAFYADHARLAGMLGEAPIDFAPPERDLGFPFTPPAHSLFALGLVEDELTDHEDRRVEGLYHETDDGRVHVGRSRPRDGTGQVDRIAHQQQIFVRGKEWQSGRYRVSGRVHFTTTYVEGTIVLGYTRRDRNVRVQFQAGDLDFSAGATEQPRVDQMRVTLNGVRDAESTFSGQEALRRFRFDGATSSFGFELVVEGGLVVAFVDGRIVGTYHTPDHTPIEGYVGFAAARGAYQVERPTITDLARARSAGIAEPVARGLHLDAGPPTTRSRMLNRRVDGIPVDRQGTVALWIPTPRPKHRAALVESTIATTRDLAERLREAGHGASLVLVLPEAATSDERRAIVDGLKASPAVEHEVLLHQKDQPLASLDDAAPMVMSMALVLDPEGVLRAIAPFKAGAGIVPHEITHWLRLYTRGPAEG